jgi:hypothetical protein
MSIETALAIAALLTAAVPAAGPEEAAKAPPSATAPAGVLAEMAPPPGRWEVEDAPAWFSDRSAFGKAPAPATFAPSEADAPVARRRP